MKKFFLILFILLISTFCIYFFKEYPNTPPTLNVYSEENNLSIPIQTNGGNWFEKSRGGNSFDLGMLDSEKLNSIDPITIPCNTKLTLDLSYSKNISILEVFSIPLNSTNNENYPKIEINNYSFFSPSNPGIYSYLVTAEWDSTHNIRYIFKIKCI